MQPSSVWTLAWRMTFVVVLTAVPSVLAGPSFRPFREIVGSDEPMTIAASCVGDLAGVNSRCLSVNSAGEAKLTTSAIPEAAQELRRASRMVLDAAKG